MFKKQIEQKKLNEEKLARMLSENPLFSHRSGIKVVKSEYPTPVKQSLASSPTRPNLAVSPKIGQTVRHLPTNNSN